VITPAPSETEKVQKEAEPVDHVGGGWGVVATKWIYHGYPWMSTDIHIMYGLPWIINGHPLIIHEYQWIINDIHGPSLDVNGLSIGYPWRIR